MDYTRLSKAINKMPDEVAVQVLSDVDKRISDWLASGGSEEDPYIEQQVRYAEEVANIYDKGDE